MQALKSHITREEYLEIDNSSTGKHEFYQGDIFAMSGGTFNHSAISTNITTTLQNLLNKTPCWLILKVSTLSITSVKMVVSGCFKNIVR